MTNATTTLVPAPLDVDCDAHPGSCDEHTHTSGRCQPWCRISRDFVVPTEGAPVDEHGPFCEGPGRYIPALTADAERRDVSVTLVSGYQHGSYPAGALGAIPEDYRGDVVQLHVTSFPGVVEDQAVFLTPANARLLSLVLGRLADRAERLEEL